LNWLECILISGIGIGLAMDAFAVSIVSGSVFKQLPISRGIRMALFFGLFQAIMPLFGSWAGKGLEPIIKPFDHWLAFGLLLLIGGKMALASFKIKNVEDKPADPSNLLTLLALSIATSIDALAVGLTLYLLTPHLFIAVLMIGTITFLISLAGWEIGSRIGRFFESGLELAGGLILIGIGLKILLQHLLAG